MDDRFKQVVMPDGGGNSDPLGTALNRVNRPKPKPNTPKVVNKQKTPAITTPAPTPIRFEASQSAVSSLPAFEAPEIYTPDYGKLQSDFDTMIAGFEDLKNSYAQSSETSKTELSNQLTSLLGEIDTSRTKNRRSLGEAQRVIQEDAFDRQRALDQQMSARGLGGSGLAQLAGIKERMATGQNISQTTQAFYENEESLIKAIDKAQTNYNTSIQKVNDSLHTALATINNQQNALRSDYSQQVMALERQVIADLNSAKQAKLMYDMQVADYSLRKQQADAEILNAERQYQLQLADFGLRKQQANAQIRNADRQYQLQLEEIRRANEQPAIGRTDIETIMMTANSDRARENALLDLGFSASEVRGIISEFSSRFGANFNPYGSVASLVSMGVPYDNALTLAQQMAGGGNQSNTSNTNVNTNNQRSQNTQQRPASNLNPIFGAGFNPY